MYTLIQSHTLHVHVETTKYGYTRHLHLIYLQRSQHTFTVWGESKMAKKEEVVLTARVSQC